MVGIVGERLALGISFPLLSLRACRSVDWQEGTPSFRGARFVSAPLLYGVAPVCLLFRVGGSTLCISASALMSSSTDRQWLDCLEKMATVALMKKSSLFAMVGVSW